VTSSSPIGRRHPHHRPCEPGDALSINGANVLASTPACTYDIKMVGRRRDDVRTPACSTASSAGQGRIAVTTKGTPVVLNVDQPTYVDPQAAICWSANLQTGYHRAEQLGLGTPAGPHHRASASR
jgi:uncharacterized protein (AIM24 family)